MPDCEKCGNYFPNYVWIEGKKRNLNKRKYCLDCSPFGLHNTKKLVGVARSRQRSPEPDPLPPSANLAYLIGVISGDGCIYKTPKTYQLTISCDDRYPELISKYAELLSSLIPRNVRIDHSNQGKYTVVRLDHVHLPTLLGLPHGAKAKNGYTVPEWIFSSLEYVRPFIRGLIETDGGVYHTYHKKAWFWYCAFSSSHESIMLAFLRGTELLGYSFKRKADKARLSNTEKVKTLISELTISKIREYRYD